MKKCCAFFMALICLAAALSGCTGKYGEVKVSKMTNRQLDQFVAEYELAEWEGYYDFLRTCAKLYEETGNCEDYIPEAEEFEHLNRYYLQRALLQYYKWRFSELSDQEISDYFEAYLYVSGYYSEMDLTGHYDQIRAWAAEVERAGLTQPSESEADYELHMLTIEIVVSGYDSMGISLPLRY